MNDITINNEESQSKNQKTTPVMKSFDVQNQLDTEVVNAILQIWQGHEESNFDLGFWRPAY